MRLRAVLLATCLVIGGAVVAPPASAAGATYVWTGDGDNSSWTDASNWSPAGVPGNGDSVTVAPYTVDHCATHVTDVPQDLALADLTLSEDPPQDGTDSDTCLASLAGGSISVSGTFTWHGGELDLPVDLLPGSVGTITPGKRTTSATDRLFDVLTVGGTLTLRDDAAGDVDKSILLGNAGTTHGTLVNGIVVAAGGTLVTKGTNDVEALACCVNPTRIVNHGTIDASGTLRLDNAVLDQDGTLSTRNAATEVDAYAGDQDRPNTAGDGARWTGPGTFRVTEASASLAVTGTQHLGSGFHLVLGGQGPGANPPDADESITGTFTLAGAGEFDWLGGHLSGRPTISTSRTVIGTTGTRGHGGQPATPGENTYVDGTKGDHPSTVTVTGRTVFEPGVGADTPALMELEDNSVLALRGTTSLPAWVEFSHGDVQNYGTLTADPGAGHSDLWSSGGLANHGRVDVRSGTLTTDDQYRQLAGSTVLASGARLRSDPVLLTGGTLSGSGAVYGGLRNSGGTLAPAGSATGTVTVHGGYTQTAGGRADLDVAHSAHDLVAVQGELGFRGRIAVENHHAPRAGATVTVVTATSGTTKLGPVCTTTTGPGSTGRGARHWVAGRRGRSIVLVWTKGRSPHC